MARHKIEIEIGGVGYAYSCPKKWEDLSRSEFLLWAGIVRQQLDVEESLDLAVHLLCGIPLDLHGAMSAGQRYELRELLRWLTDNNMVRNVIGTLCVGFRRYYGPAHRLANLTIAEYRRTELYYQFWLRTKDRKYLCLLAATLWRPRGVGSSDDVRVEVKEKSLQTRALFFNWAMHPVIMYAILLYYEGCRNHIIKSHPVVFRPMAMQQDSPFSKPPDPNAIVDLEDHILAYAGGKFGTYNETARTNIYVFFKNMSQQIEEYERRARR